MNLDINGLNAEFAPTRRRAPHLIPALHEDNALQILLPPNLPALQVAAPNVAAPLGDAPHPPFHNQGTPRFQPFEELLDTWPVYSNMDYLGVDEHIQEEWDEENRPERENVDDDKDTAVDNNTKSHHHELVVPTKRRDPMSDDRRLLQQIHTSSLHIPTLDLLDPAMPDATRAPEFGPVLEPRPQE